MNGFTEDDLRQISTGFNGPCLSAFTSLTPGKLSENRLRLRTLEKNATSQLAVSFDDIAIDELLGPIRRMILNESEIPKSVGIAYFAFPTIQTVYSLRSPPREQIVIGSVPMIRPLLREIRDIDYLVLTISQRSAKLYRGNVHGLREVLVPGMPAGMEDAIQNHDSDEPLNLHSFRRSSATAPEAIFHGQGIGIDDHKDDLVRYIRVIHRAIHPFLRVQSIPMVLVGVDSLFPLFRATNSYPHLRHEGVSGNPEHMSLHELHQHTWSLFAADLEFASNRAIEKFRQSRGSGRTLCDIRAIVNAAIAGWIETLLLTPNAYARGHYDPIRHDTETSGSASPEDEDLWNLAAVHVLRHKGFVHEVDSELFAGLDGGAVLRMPLAGICE